MNVGSAKIDVASCPDVPHHLLDVVDVSQSFSALDYYNLAVPVIQVSYQLTNGSQSLFVHEIISHSCMELDRAIKLVFILLCIHLHTVYIDSYRSMDFRVSYPEAVFHWW